MRGLALFVLLGCAAEPPAREWTLVYYLPYDNDLASHADPILDELERGVGPRTAIVALVDRPGAGGMERVVITGERRNVERTVEHVDGDDSADARTLGRLLDHAAARAPSAHVALFVLDHGGKLDELGLDEHPERRWMSALDLQRELAARRRRHGRLDLLMLQQCGRGSAETYYALRDEADVLLASQGIIAAPNDYYGGMLRAIERGEVETAEELARAVIESEPPEMFVEYTALRGPALSALPEHLDAAIAPLLEAPASYAANALTLRWAEEQYADLLLFLRELYRAHALDEAPLDALETFVESAVVHRRISASSPRAQSLSGVSILAPADPRVLDRYARSPLYRRSHLDELLRRHPQAPADVIELPGSTISARP